MKCPYVAGNYMLSCAARREVYIPSTFEFAEYCNSERYERFKVCSYYMEMYKGSQIKLCHDGEKYLQKQQS